MLPVLVCRVFRLRFVAPTVSILLMAAWGGASSAQVTPAPNWSQQSPATSPPPRNEAMMAYDAGTNQVVLFGGEGNNGPMNDTWIWNGASWMEAATTGPSPRTTATMAYDASSGLVVLFGGSTENDPVLGDTWVWNGTTSTWTQLSPIASPPARANAMMAYDAATGQIVLFGGDVNSTQLGDTWTFNGTTWTQLSPAKSPSARSDAMMAYDAATGQVVLFGGMTSNFESLNDTWTFNGTTWTQLTPATSPSAESNAMMAYDAATGQVVLFGGLNSRFGPLNDTWTFNGTTSTWTQQTPATSPSVVSNAMMAYDAATNQVVLFGGLESGGISLNDTWTLQPGAVNLGNANVCPAGATTPAPCSQTETLSFYVAAGTTIGSVNTLTQGAPNLDFTAAAATQESNACSATTSASICTVTVTFAPTKAGTRDGAVVIEDGSGNALATTYVFGAGQGPQLSFSPPTQSVIGSGLQFPKAVAVDGSGNVYIADTSNVLKVPSTDLTCATASDCTTIVSDLLYPSGVAVDGSGNVYIADGGNSSILKETPSGSSYTQSTVGSNLIGPSSVAVDGSGNVYIAGAGDSVVKETLSGGSYTESTITPTGVDDSFGIAVDGSGNIYLAYTLGRISQTGSVQKETPSSNGSYTQSTIPASGLESPFAVAVDGSGNVYIANTGTNNLNGNVLKEDYADAPPLVFATPTRDDTTDTTDGVLSVQIENIGNEPLMAVMSGLSVGANFMQVDGSGTPADCTASFSLAVNASCNISVEFAPVAPATGTVNGSVTLTDNNLNATPNAMQTIPLTGTSVVQITILPATLPGATVGAAYTTTLAASGGTAPYTYSILSGALPAGITFTGGVLSGASTASGTFNFTVMATDSSAAPGPYSGTASYSLLVNAAPVTDPLDFTFTDTGASTFTGTPGAVATYNFALAPLMGAYADPVSFTVTGLPSGATASFTPSTVAANSGATTVVMSVQTAAAMAQDQRSPFGRGIVLALLLLPFGIKSSLRRRLNGKMLLLLLLLAGTTAAVGGCGSSNGSPLQSPQTYMLTVTATSGMHVHNQSVTLIEQ